MKQKLQGILTGIVLTTLLFSTITAFAAAPTTIDVIVGTVRTTLFGQEFVTRNAQGTIIEPFIHNGTAFIPVDTILQALGENAQWNAATNTLNFGDATGQVAGQAATGGRVYLENDIQAVQSSGGEILRHPPNPTFTMQGTPYSTGLSTLRPIGTQARITYDIVGRNFTRFSGIFGGINWFGGTSISLTIIADGRTISQGDNFMFTSGNFDKREISIVIPPGTREIEFVFQNSGRNEGRVALGNAFFQ
ncbi:MAG: copper amine oxidase N-terminal domain-containing protein [Firmicutes bacterium]|nr:copper amine oxidase N-terminal domain-containing protein [Bacillota bacterium]